MGNRWGDSQAREPCDASIHIHCLFNQVANQRKFIVHLLVQEHIHEGEDALVLCVKFLHVFVGDSGLDVEGKAQPLLVTCLVRQKSKVVTSNHVTTMECFTTARRNTFPTSEEPVSSPGDRPGPHPWIPMEKTEIGSPRGFATLVGYVRHHALLLVFQNHGLPAFQTQFQVHSTRFICNVSFPIQDLRRSSR